MVSASRYSELIARCSVFSTLFLFYVLVSVAPLVDSYLFGLFNHQRFLQVFFIFLSLVIFPLQIRIGKASKAFILIFLSILIIYIYQTPHISSVLFSSFYFSLFLLFTTLRNIDYEFKPIAFTLLIGNILICAMSTMNIAFQIYDTGSINSFDTYYGFLNIRHFNQFQIASLPFVIYFCLSNNLKRVAYTCLFINIFLLILGEARGAIISLIVFFTFLHNSTSIENKNKLNKTILFAITSFSLSFILLTLNPTLLESELKVRLSSSLRYEIWSNNFVEITQSKAVFIFGYGPGSYLDSKFFLGHAHNFIIHTLFEFGVIGAIILFYFLYMTWLIKAKNETEKLIHSAFWSLICLSLVSGAYIMPLPQTVMLLLCAIIWNRKSIENHHNGVAYWRRCFNAILSTTTCCLLVYLSLMTIKCKTNDHFGPKFWVNGNMCNQYKEVNLDKRYE